MAELKSLLAFMDEEDRARALAENEADDLENIHALGEGWVGDEALAIAVYCALRHRNDFSAGLIAAVNHKGDSDSTGAIAGNILGAWLGCGAIDNRWKTDLELYDVILAIADDLCRAGQEEAFAADPGWQHKYNRTLRNGASEQEGKTGITARPISSSPF